MGQLTRDRLKALGISLNTGLGQNFLVDDNILTVIERLAAPTAADVVYEPGPGLGVLTDFLAPHVRHIHVVELDERMKPALIETAQQHGNISIQFADVLRVDPKKLDPPPSALISNLPYTPAAPLIATILRETPQITRFIVMLQREIAERMFAPVGDSNYGALSVTVQVACEQQELRPVPRTVFLPQPNVESALLAFKRTAPSDLNVDAVAALARQSFMHRRKTLANNLRSAGYASKQIALALEQLEVDARIRPQDLTPQQFIDLEAVLQGF